MVYKWFSLLLIEMKLPKNRDEPASDIPEMPEILGLG